MKQAAVGLQWVVRLVGLIMIVLGLVIWSGHGENITSTHKFFGFVLVVALWALAVIGFRAGVPPVFLLLVVAWSILMPALGLTQTDLVTGDAHWLIRVVHLLVGLVALGLGDRLADSIRYQLSSGRPPAPAATSE